MDENLSDKSVLDPASIRLKHITEPKCPVVLLLDVSYSMEGKKIDAMKEGISLLLENLKKDDVARKRVELCVITFGEGVKVVHDFSTVSDYDNVSLSVNGYTPMGEGIIKAISKIEERKSQYRQFGVDYYRPWIWMITDGDPTDMGPREGTYAESVNDTGTGRPIENNNIPNEFFDLWDNVVEKVRSGESEKKFVFFAIGVEDADMETLSKISVNRPVKLKGLDFKSMFNWLSKSLSSQSRSGTGTQIKLESPDEWGTIEQSKPGED